MCVHVSADVDLSTVDESNSNSNSSSGAISHSASVSVSGVLMEDNNLHSAISSPFSDDALHGLLLQAFAFSDDNETSQVRVHVQLCLICGYAHTCVRVNVRMCGCVHMIGCT
jgi:hypothetical protein